VTEEQKDRLLTIAGWVVIVLVEIGWGIVVWLYR